MIGASGIRHGLRICRDNSNNIKTSRLSRRQDGFYPVPGAHNISEYSSKIDAATVMVLM